LSQTTGEETGRATASGSRLSLGLRGLCAVLAAAHVVAFLAVACGRIRYPYDLEWLEGGVLLHSYEMLAGHPLYRPPSADFIGFPYQPLYMAVVAVLGRVFGLSLPLARAVSLASSLALSGLVGRIVWRETSSRWAAWLAAATVVALFRVTGYWLDLARVDSLFLALLVGGLFCARYVEGPWRAGVSSAVLLILAYKTKQLALPFFVLAPPALYRQGRGKRAALAFLPLVAAPLALDALYEEWCSHGWFSFYMNVIPSGQPVRVGRLPALIQLALADIPVLALLAASGCFVALRPASWSRRLGETWALAPLLGFVATFLAWARPGGFANNLLPAYVFAIVPAYVELHRLAPRLRPHVQSALWGGLAVQFALLGYDPRTQIPGPADYAAGEELVARLRAAPGPVLVPERPWLAVLAGKKPSYHSSAFWEMSFQERPDLIPEDLRRHLASGDYGLVIVGSDPAKIRDSRRWFPPELARAYVCEERLHLPGRALVPFTSSDNTPRVVCAFRGKAEP
jgi:hypothetical protein